MPNKQPRKEDILNILNEYGIPLNKLIGWLANYEKPKEHANRLRQFTMMGTKGADNDYWNPKEPRKNLDRNLDDITLIRNITNNQLSLGRTQDAMQMIEHKFNSNWIQIEPRMTSQ